MRVQVPPPAPRLAVSSTILACGKDPLIPSSPNRTRELGFPDTYNLSTAFCGNCCTPPGNIRELQNVIERSVVVCETENFSLELAFAASPCD
jgi:hypothetical protein